MRANVVHWDLIMNESLTKARNVEPQSQLYATLPSSLLTYSNGYSFIQLIIRLFFRKLFLAARLILCHF